MRTTFRRRSTALIAALALTVAACAGDDTDAEAPDTDDTEAETDDEASEGDDGAAAADVELIADGALTVCSDVPYPPFEFEDADAPSGYAGFDMDLVQEIADRLDVELAVVETGFDALESGAALAAGQCDLAASAMTITPDRAENLNFSDPYYEAQQSLIVLVDGDIESLEDVTGSLGVQGNTTGAEFANENAPDGVEIIEYPSGPDLFTAMLAGQVEAGLQDFDVNALRVQEDDRFAIVEEFATGEEYGLAAARDADELIDTINDVLADIIDDGTYDEIFERYFGA